MGDCVGIHGVVVVIFGGCDCGGKGDVVGASVVGCGVVVVGIIVEVTSSVVGFIVVVA